jgi:Ca2+-binding EF-hand superfamily protein
MQQAQGAYLQAQPVQAQQQQPQPQRAPLRSGAPIEEKRAAAQQAFQMYDTDRSGTIDMNEFASALGYLGLQISREDAGAIFCIIDSDGNGTLSMTEFIEHYVANY